MTKAKTVQSSIAISPIGYVRKKNEYEGHLEISGPYRSALTELEGFSHIHVIWWGHLCDNNEDRKVTVCHKPYVKSPETVGVFATRSERRPNPVEMTIVPVLKIDQDKGIIEVPFMDAENNTPIVDIKPYHPATDRVKEIAVPQWSAHWPQYYEESAEFDWEAEFVGAAE